MSPDSWYFSLFWFYDVCVCTPRPWHETRLAAIVWEWTFFFFCCCSRSEGFVLAGVPLLTVTTWNREVHNSAMPQAKRGEGWRGGGLGVKRVNGIELQTCIFARKLSSPTLEKRKGAKRHALLDGVLSRPLQVHDYDYKIVRFYVRERTMCYVPVCAFHQWHLELYVSLSVSLSIFLFFFFFCACVCVNFALCIWEVVFFFFL